MAIHAANSLISDLAEMVQAVEAMPRVQAELDATKDIATKLASTIEHRDAHIKDLRAELDSLLTSLKQTEASRDDAELRFLELEDRVGKLTSAFALAHQNVAMANAVATEVQGWLKPPAPEPMAEAEGQHEVIPEPQGQSAADPTLGTDTHAAEIAGSSASSEAGSASQFTAATANEQSGTLAEGVSVPTDPTASANEQASPYGAASEPTTASTQAEWRHEEDIRSATYAREHAEVPPLPLPSASSPAPTPTSTPEAAASANGSASPSADAGGQPTGPYTGKHYTEIVDNVAINHISQPDWVAGGGALNDYWR